MGSFVKLLQAYVDKLILYIVKKKLLKTKQTGKIILYPEG